MTQAVVLETSYWTVGYYVQVNQYLFDYFNIYITKELKQVSERECMVEANLLKKIFMLGMRQVLLDEALNAYLKSEMSISEVAGYYNIHYGDIFIELKNRNIPILDERVDVDDELSFLSKK